MYSRIVVCIALALGTPGLLVAQAAHDSLNAQASRAADTIAARYQILANTISQAESTRRAIEDSIRIEFEFRATRNQVDNALERLTTIEKKLAAKDSAERVARIARYRAGSEALNDMSKGVTLISFMEGLVDAEASLQSVTNIWRDPSFRNAYDDVETWGTIAAGALASLALFSDDGPMKPEVALSSSGLTLLVSKLAGTLWGEDKGDVVANQVITIEVSRRAYDDLRIRSDALKQYIFENEQLQSRIAQALAAYPSKADTTLAVAEVVGLLSQFDGVLRQIPIYIGDLRTASETYARMYGLGLRSDLSARCMEVDFFPENLGQGLCTLIRNLDRLDERYHKDVMPLLQVSPQIVAILSSR